MLERRFYNISVFGHFPEFSQESWQRNGISNPLWGCRVGVHMGWLLTPCKHLVRVVSGLRHLDPRCSSGCRFAKDHGCRVSLSTGFGGAKMMNCSHCLHYTVILVFIFQMCGRVRPHHRWKTKTMQPNLKVRFVEACAMGVDATCNSSPNHCGNMFIEQEFGLMLMSIM